MANSTQTILISNKMFNNLRHKGKLERNEYKYFKPGMVWLCPWLFDPHHFSDKKYINEYSKRYFKHLLSIYYWVDWSRKRPPITLMLPNREIWCIDEKPNSHYGWRVEQSLPNLTLDGQVKIKGWEGVIQNGQLISQENPHFLKSLKLF